MKTIFSDISIEEIIFTIIIGVIFSILITILINLITNKNKEICLGGHYEITNTFINGRQYPHKTFICDSAKIIYK